MNYSRKSIASAFSMLVIFGALSLTSCEGEDGLDGINGEQGELGEPGVDGADGDVANVDAVFSNKSATLPLVSINPEFSGFVSATSLISTPDVLADGFQLAGSVDGAGFLPNQNGEGYIYVVNNEDSYSVSRIFLDENLTPTGGDYLLNSGVDDFARQCSGTMWEAAIHGGSQDLFLSASESFHYDIKGINPHVTTPTPNADFGLDALGEFGWENAVPLPQGAYPGQTVIIGGDDDSNEETAFGQITLYHSENGDADLEGGSIYVLRFKEISGGDNPDFNPDETEQEGNLSRLAIPVDPAITYDESNLDRGFSYEVEFVEIENGADLTVTEMGEACVGVNASAFMRVEDVDYQKGSDENARNVFVAVTGRGPGRGTFNDWGTVYKLELDADSPLTGRLTQIVSGNTDTNNQDGNLSDLQSPDNITVTENFIYIQEDPNSFARNHTARIYQSDLSGNGIRTVLDLVVRQDLAIDRAVGRLDGDQGEFGALVDISETVGIPDTFLLNLQPHYWESEDFQGLDGDTYNDRPGTRITGESSTGREDDQASQIVLLRGLPR